DHFFIDLFENNGVIFSDTFQNIITTVYVNENGKSVVEWLPGSRYPEGTLIQREINNPDNKNILYDLSELPRSKSENFELGTSKQVSFTQDQLQEIDASFPLIIPSWSHVELFVHYHGEHYSQSLSISTINLLFNSWSESKHATKLEYQHDLSPSHAFIQFGDLKFTYKGKDLVFEGIAPIWQFDEKLGLLVTVSVDAHAYIWNLKEDNCLPIGNFKINIPHSIEISPDGRMIAAISFSISEAKMLGRTPTSESTSTPSIKTLYPLINLYIYNVHKQKRYKRSIRFPTHLNRLKTTISINFQEDAIVFSFPSFLDLDNYSTMIFDLYSNKFSKQSVSSISRYWKSHSKNSPVNQLSKGEEYPIEPHPEIKREYSQRPFYLLDKDLIRKSDQILIASAEVAPQIIPQLSTSEIYTLKDTSEIRLPFSPNRNKPIYLSTDDSKLFQIKTYLKLPRLKHFPVFHTIPIVLGGKSIGYLQRLKRFIQRIIDDECIHNENGIAFRKSALEVDIYISKLEVSKQAIDSAIYSFSK
ncbi:MAG: hypothetical protein ACXAD7_11005, partial [Candidatus Kariarchaeaceae archaeon]